jgi:hypothetical protein
MILAGLLLAAGCAAAPQPAGNSQDVILDAPEAKVRAAFVRVLTDGGYDVMRDEENGTTIRTGYREEISSYNWLYRSRFGVNRSKVTVTLAPEGETATRVSVQVTYEGKDGDWMPLTGSWVPYDAAVAQSAANTIRLVKNELGLL